MKIATVALMIRRQARSLEMVEYISDDREIAVYEAALSVGDPDPLKKVHEHRAQQTQEDLSFADYVEDLVSQPFQRPEIKENGIQWLKARMRIEEFQRNEYEAAKIIAEFALQIYLGDPTRTDFSLSGSSAQVRVRVFVLPQDLTISSLA